MRWSQEPALRPRSPADALIRDEFSLTGWRRSWARVRSDLCPTPPCSPLLHAGQSYWLVAEAATPSGRSPVWNRSHDVNATVGLSAGSGSAWSIASGPAFAAVVEGQFIGCGSSDFNGDGDSATDQ